MKSIKTIMKNRKFRKEPKLDLAWVKCVKSIDGNFKVGKWYPIIDYNNGNTIMGEKIQNRDSFFHTEPFHCFGMYDIANPEEYPSEDEKYRFTTEI